MSNYSCFFNNFPISILMDCGNNQSKITFVTLVKKNEIAFNSFPKSPNILEWRKLFFIAQNNSQHFFCQKWSVYLIRKQGRNIKPHRPQASNCCIVHTDIKLTVSHQASDLLTIVKGIFLWKDKELINVYAFFHKNVFLFSEKSGGKKWVKEWKKWSVYWIRHG